MTQSNSKVYPDSATRPCTHDALARSPAKARMHPKEGPVASHCSATDFADECATFDFAHSRNLDQAIAVTIGALKHQLAQEVVRACLNDAAMSDCAIREGADALEAAM